MTDYAVKPVSRGGAYGCVGPRGQGVVSPRRGAAPGLSPA